MTVDNAMLTAVANMGHKKAVRKRRQSKPEKKSFAFRLYDLLNNKMYSDIIRWLPGGDGFYIVDVPRFTAEIAPAFFKRKLSSCFS